MLGGSYIRNADGSLTLQQRTLEPDEAQAAIAAPAAASSSPGADGDTASAQPDAPATAKPKKGA